MGFPGVSFGSSLWLVLHTLTRIWDASNMSDEQRELAKSFITNGFGMLIPCEQCRGHFKDMIQSEFPITDREKLFPWTVEAHLRVSQRVDKEAAELLNQSPPESSTYRTDWCDEYPNTRYLTRRFWDEGMWPWLSFVVLSIDSFSSVGEFEAAWQFGLTTLASILPETKGDANFSMIFASFVKSHGMHRSHSGRIAWLTALHRNVMSGKSATLNVHDTVYTGLLNGRTTLMRKGWWELVIGPSDRMPEKNDAPSIEEKQKPMSSSTCTDDVSVPCRDRNLGCVEPMDCYRVCKPHCKEEKDGCFGPRRWQNRSRWAWIGFGVFMLLIVLVLGIWMAMGPSEPETDVFEEPVAPEAVRVHDGPTVYLNEDGTPASSVDDYEDFDY